MAWQSDVAKTTTYYIRDEPDNTRQYIEELKRVRFKTRSHGTIMITIAITTKLVVGCITLHKVVHVE